VTFVFFHSADGPFQGQSSASCTSARGMRETDYLFWSGFKIT